MAIARSTITAPAITSWASLGSGSSASSAAITVGTSANVVDHEVIITINGPATMTGSASTNVTAYVYGSNDGTTWTGSGTTNELVDGTDKAITFSANGNNGTLLGTVNLTTTSAGTSITYRGKVMSIFAALGCAPSKYVIVITNNAGAALAASGHSLSIQELYYN